ncbi:hypothetical protein [Pseudomonas sp. NA-150]|uniref:hypothetical protein n=1 Tax=Pseudomonas sp. NA-150 TaxID=3367525 RepID=UPI0037C9E3F8
MKDFIITKVSVAVLFLFLCALLSGIFLPIYSDEVMAKWSLGRFFLEDQELISFFPQCTSTTGRAISAVFYPAGIVLSLIYSHLEPLGIRVSGIVCTIVWFSLIGWWCYQQTRSVKTATHRLAGLVALSSLGITPYLWVMSRSEQVLTITLLLLCLFALFLKQTKSATKRNLGGIALTVTLSCFFYSHPKSLFFFPFVLLATWLATGAYNKLVRFSFVLFVIVLCYQVYHDSSALAVCGDAPFVQKMLTSNTLLPNMLFSNPWDFFSAALNNLIMFPERFLLHLTYNANFQSGWLPPIDVSDSVWLVSLNAGIAYLIGFFVLGSHLVCLLIYLAQLVLRKTTATSILAPLLVISNLFNVLFYNLQNFYAGTQFIPVSVVLVALMLQSMRQIRPLAGVSASAYFILMACSTVSLIALFSLVTPSIIKHASSDLATIDGQPLSIPVLGATSHIESIKTLGAKCGISDASTANLVVDHMTYFAYLSDRSPIHVLYVSELGYGGDLTGGKLLPFLKKLNSPGIISRCEWIPNEFRAAQKSNDMGYCCVNINEM